MVIGLLLLFESHYTIMYHATTVMYTGMSCSVGLYGAYALQRESYAILTTTDTVKFSILQFS